MAHRAREVEAAPLALGVGDESARHVRQQADEGESDGAVAVLAHRPRRLEQLFARLPALASPLRPLPLHARPASRSQRRLAVVGSAAGEEGGGGEQAAVHRLR